MFTNTPVWKQYTQINLSQAHDIGINLQTKSYFYDALSPWVKYTLVQYVQ